MNLKSLSQLGRVEKEVELTPEIKVRLHTLSVSEQQKALIDIPESIKDETVRYSYLQLSMLVYATDSVNGETATPDELHTFYSDLQYPLLTSLFAKYLELSDTQTKVLEELKKKQ